MTGASVAGFGEYESAFARALCRQVLFSDVAFCRTVKSPSCWSLLFLETSIRGGPSDAIGSSHVDRSRARRGEERANKPTKRGKRESSSRHQELRSFNSLPTLCTPKGWPSQEPTSSGNLLEHLLSSSGLPNEDICPLSLLDST